MFSRFAARYDAYRLPRRRHVARRRQFRDIHRQRPMFSSPTMIFADSFRHRLRVITFDLRRAIAAVTPFSATPMSHFTPSGCFSAFELYCLPAGTFIIFFTPLIRHFHRR
jgi:hypothetical protein